MTHLDTGYTGAKRQSWKKANPRYLLFRVVDANPRARGDRDKILRLFREELANADPAYIDTIVENWFTRNYNSLTDRGPQLTAEAREQKKQAEAKTAAKYKVKLQETVFGAAKILLLGLTMTNGKTLANCTGRDCRELAKKTSPWLTKIADKIKPNERVGDRLSEADVRKLYG